MHILLFHPTFLPPKDYGGVERVVLWLAQGLLEQKHRVSIAALKGSKLPLGCELLEVVKKNYTSAELNRLIPRSVDVIHFMAPISPEVWNGLEKPAVLTVHGNGQAGEKFPENTVFLSQNHAKRHHAECFVYNGINPDEFVITPETKVKSFLFLSKTSWRVKNLSGAMRYCAQAKVSLKIAGGLGPIGLRLKSLFSPRTEWVGPVFGEKKALLLAQAQALIFPVNWEEPFGLVVAESLMSGTPVYASPRGSLPELISSEVGGLFESPTDWVNQLRSHSGGMTQAKACRSWAMKKFHYLSMAKSYEEVYTRVLAKELLHQRPPFVS